MRPSVDQVMQILQNIVRMLGQGADAQLHRTQLIEMGDQFRGGDADEPRGESALGDEGLGGATRHRAHRAGDFDVLGEVEVVRARLAGRLRDPDVAVERQARDDRIHRVGLQMRRQRRRIGGIQRQGGEVPGAVRPHHRIRRGAVHVGQPDLVGAGFGQEA